MKINRWIGFLCAVALLVSPLKVFASGTEVNIKADEEPIIEMLTSEQAEVLYKQLYGEPNVNRRSDLGACEIGLSNSDGKLLVIYSTACRGIASKIGVRNFTLEEKKGLFWSDITIKNEYSENTDAFFGGFYIVNPVEGRKYRAHCIHYAVIGGKETSMYSESDAYTFS